MIVTVPKDKPVTIPLPEKVAITESLLFQLPPVELSVRAVVDPMHPTDPPEIGFGNGSTVIAVVALQPVPPRT